MKKLIALALALILTLAALPFTAAAKELNVEQKFRLLIEDMELDPAVHSADRYFYEELATHYNAGSPEYVLIRAGLINLSPSDALDEHWGTIGDHYVAAYRRCAPFSYGFGVYDVKENTFYDLVDAWNMNFTELHDIWNNLPIKLNWIGDGGYAVPIGDADADGRVTILDATRIQRILAALDTDRWPDLSKDKANCDHGYPIGSINDADRDGKTTILDATYIQRGLADLPHILGFEEAVNDRVFTTLSDRPPEITLIRSQKELSDFCDCFKGDENIGKHIAAYPDSYFKTAALIGIYVNLPSGSMSITPKSISLDNSGALTVDALIHDPGEGTTDENQRFILLEISNAFTDDIGDVTLRVTTAKDQSVVIADYVPTGSRTMTAPADLNSGGYRPIVAEKLDISGPRWDEFSYSEFLADADDGYVLLIRDRKTFEKYLPDFDTEKKLDDFFFSDYAVIAVLAHGGDHNAYAAIDSLAVKDAALYCNPWIGINAPLDEYGNPILLPTDPLVWTFRAVRQETVNDVKSIAFWKRYNAAAFEEIITDDKKVTEGSYGSPIAYDELRTASKKFSWDYQKYGDGQNFLNQPYRVAIITTYAQYSDYFNEDRFPEITAGESLPIWRTVGDRNSPLDEKFFENNALIVGVGYFSIGEEYLYFDEIDRSDDGRTLIVRFNRYSYGDLHPDEVYAANILGYCCAAASVPKDTVKYINAVQMLPQVKKLPYEIYEPVDYEQIDVRDLDAPYGFPEANDAVLITTREDVAPAIDRLMVDMNGNPIAHAAGIFPITNESVYNDSYFETHDILAARVYRGGSSTRLYVTNLERSVDNLLLEITVLHDGYDTPDNAWSFIFLGVKKQTGSPNIVISMVDEENYPMPEKPILYLYPEEETELTVTLGKPEELTCTYPAYNDGWHVTAYPDGTLVDDGGRSYYALYWESRSTTPVSMADGFVVKGEDTASFFEEKLAVLGLNEREAQEFIVYWLPQMQNNQYNLIRFATADEIEQIMPLSFSVRPDTVIRVLMEYTPLDEPVDVPEQNLTPAPERKGFTAVEWGGMLIR